jgi:hypothetical protein
MFDDDPKYQKLKAIREGGYDGPLDQDLREVAPTDPRAQVLDALRRTGA